uniref:C2H2-type domain-containing protein n=1 Tax=Anopheles dirus TaxID=7168 RepID=A0A182NI09_9DIPT
MDDLPLPLMLGKYGEAASSGSMKNLENGLRDRVLYHQNMLSMNLTAEFYHNPFLSASTGGVVGNSSVGTTSGATGMAQQSQKIPHHPQQTVAASTLTQFQCQLCQKCFISNVLLAQHMKTHESNGFVTREGTNYVQQQQQQSVPTAPSPVITVATSNSKTSPTILAQHIIKTEYVGGSSSGHSMGQFSYGSTKQFECQICHKSFMTQVNLNLHMKIHDMTELKPAPMYSQITGSGTSGYQTPSTHHTQQQQHATMVVGTHDGVCQICHKTFSTADQFAAHMKIHENEFKNRALYHSGGGANGADGGSSTPLPPGNGTSDHFYAATLHPTQQLAHASQHPPPHLDASKGHRCPICHKMSNNIIEHIKQHEGQLTMGGSGGAPDVA